METAVKAAEIFIRALSSAVVLFLLSKMLGPRQISQMSFYDYIVGISIGSIAAVMAVDDSIPFWYPLIGMIVYALFTLAASCLTDKSIVVRRVFTGVPSILIDAGVIIEKNLSKNHLDVNDLLSVARTNGFFNLNEVYYAIMEPTGMISFLPRAEKKPLTPEDMDKFPSQSNIMANVIIDGNIMQSALKEIGKDSKWLKKSLSLQGISSEKDVLLATADTEGQINVYRKECKTNKRKYFL